MATNLIDPRLRRKITPRQMIALRRGGAKFKDIAREAGITPTRVSQIVRPKLPEEEDPHYQKRQEKRAKKERIYTAVSLSKGVRQALETMATKQNETMSQFMTTAITNRILSLGGSIVEEPKYTGEPLPFQEAPL